MNCFRVVLDNISDGGISVDTEEKVTTINKIAPGVFKHTPSEIIDQNTRSSRVLMEKSWKM